MLTENVEKCCFNDFQNPEILQVTFSHHKNRNEQ